MKMRIGPFAIARAFASFWSVIVRSSSLPTNSDGVASSFSDLSIGHGNLALPLDFLRHLLRAKLPHREELEHAVLHVA